MCSQIIPPNSNSITSKRVGPATSSPTCSADVDPCTVGSSPQRLFTDLKTPNDQFANQIHSCHSHQDGNLLESQVNVSLSSQVKDSSPSVLVPQASTGQAKKSSPESDSQPTKSQVTDSSTHPNLPPATQDIESPSDGIKDMFRLSTIQVSDMSGDSSTTHFTVLTPGPIKTDSKTQVTTSPVSYKQMDPVTGEMRFFNLLSLVT